MITNLEDTLNVERPSFLMEIIDKDIFEKRLMDINYIALKITKNKYYIKPIEEIYPEYMEYAYNH